MVNAFPGNSARPSDGSWVQRWLERRAPHPDSFDCAVRVVAGTVPGESARWRFRPSAVDRRPPSAIDRRSPSAVAEVVLHHGRSVTLRLFGAEVISHRPPRPGHVVVAAVDAVSGAGVEVSLPAGELARLGLDVGL